MGQGESIWKDLLEVIPSGVNSPARAALGFAPHPIIAQKGERDQMIDVDGKAYIDYIGSWGALIHGHAHPEILSKVYERMALGTTFGMTTPIEEKIARKVTSLVPSIEKIRFVSTGTEATMSAIRLSRGFTGKNKIIKFNGHYHGHVDHLLVKAGSGVFDLPESSSKGVPYEFIKHTISLPFNDCERALQVFRDPEISQDIAGVILEPIAGNMGTVPGDREFIHLLREETKKIDALLIFDEVITGFRVHLQGAQALYDVVPDLTCYGKIIGGGFPAAAFGGRKIIMDFLAPLGPVYQAGTLSGNPVAMEAGLQALNLLEKAGFYKELQRKTDLLTEPIQDYLQKRNYPACLQQRGSMFTLFFGKKSVKNMEEANLIDRDKFKKFYQVLLREGILIPPSPFESLFVSQAHTDNHLEKTSQVIINFLKENP